MLNKPNKHDGYDVFRESLPSTDQNMNRKLHDCPSSCTQSLISVPGIEGQSVEDQIARAAASTLDLQEGGNHYKRFPIQPVEFCQKNKIGFAESNVVKYVCRHPHKHKAEDLKKAMHYLQMALELEYGVKSEVKYSDE